jgi:hypothetical protein
MWPIETPHSLVICQISTDEVTSLWIVDNELQVRDSLGATLLYTIYLGLAFVIGFTSDNRTCPVKLFREY